MNSSFSIGLGTIALLFAVAAGVWIYTSTANEQLSFDLGQGVTVTSVNDNSFRFTHPRYGFSLEFPKELKIERHQEGTASETITFEEADSEDLAVNERGFQIFVTPYAETQITEERLKMDVEGTVENPQEIILGDGTRAGMFINADPVLGRLREVWIIHDGFLYEVTTYETLDAWLAGILKTWKFEG